MAKPRRHSKDHRIGGKHLVHFSYVGGSITDADVNILARGFLMRGGGGGLLGEPFISKRGGYREVSFLLAKGRIVPHQARFARRAIAASRLPEKDPFVINRFAQVRHETTSNQQLSATG